ncbi:MAG: T9SS type A sorting domain-containing protein [Bacteroidales bacterium]|nr:T9SS type A sorting domain-containing protein [Bacteroidales bacterium]
MKTESGCDSVYQLTLKVTPVYSFAEKQEICKGGVYAWHGRKLQAEGVYYDSLKTKSGCDSVYQLTLKVNPVYFFAEKQAICKGGIYAWHGRKLQAEGVYYDSLKTKSGCDSVYQLTLMVYPTFVEADTVVICADLLPYVWHGRNLLVEGDYADSLHTSHGCDSVCALRLIVNPVFVTAISDTICEGVPYNRYGFVLPSDSTVGTSQLTLTDSLRSVEGCDSVVTLSLHIRILPKEMSMIYGDTLVSKAGTYMYYTDTLAGIDRYEWQVIPQSIAITPSESKVWLDFDRSSAGWDTLVLIGHHVCGQTAPRMFPIHVIIGDDVTKVSLQEGVSIYPNPAQSEVCIELPSFESWDKPRWMLCDMQGRVLDGGSIEGMQTRIRLDDYPRGVYVVRLLSAGSRQCSLKVVKY